MGDITAIVIVLAALVAFLVLFFLIEQMTKDKKKPAKKSEPKPIKQEQATPPLHHGMQDEPDCFASELNQNNLANDIESLIPVKVKEREMESASSRSRLATRSRVREYYEQRSAEHKERYGVGLGGSSLGSVSGVDRQVGVEGNSQQSMNIGGFTITQEDIKKLTALKAYLDEDGNRNT
jgi:hypothetical protein